MKGADAWRYGWSDGILCVKRACVVSGIRKRAKEEARCDCIRNDNGFYCSRCLRQQAFIILNENGDESDQIRSSRRQVAKSDKDGTLTDSYKNGCESGIDEAVKSMVTPELLFKMAKKYRPLLRSRDAQPSRPADPKEIIDP